MLVILELDAAGKPLCAASITDDRGEPVRALAEWAGGKCEQKAVEEE